MNSNDQPLEYMKRTRYYYHTLGYDEPYEWAHHEDIPFAALQKPLAECSVAIVTTAAPYLEDAGDQGPGAPYNSAAKFFSVYAQPIQPMPDLRISHVAIDRDHTTAVDMGSYFPLAALQQAEQNNKIGRIADRFFGLPTNRSKRTTLDTDCQQLLSYCKEDNVDVVLLLPNCPVCHQSVSLAARTLESAGIPTVVMGCAKDIVEHAGVPRFLFSDFPLGNSAGRPNDTASQYDSVNMALELAASATEPGTTVQSPYQWNGELGWKDDYSNPDRLSTSEIQRRRKAFDDAKAAAKLRQKSSSNLAFHSN